MKVGIKSIGSISALGHEQNVVKGKWFNDESYVSINSVEPNKPVAPIPSISENILSSLSKENLQYRDLDRSVLMGITAARLAVNNANWENLEGVGVNMGSSRGATNLFEKHFGHYLNDPTKKLPVKTSPTTTLGNLSSWIAQDLGLQGIAFSHSITCSTAMHAIANGIAWIKSGMSDRFLVGGAEAPLTPFTIGQMEALRIYGNSEDYYPCRPYNDLKNTMVLGEAAVTIALDSDEGSCSYFIKGLGYATEKIEHAASLSNDAECQRKAMEMAMNDFGGSIDMVITHAPGTILGDRSELSALKDVFGKELPYYWSNKWKVGHTLGASGALSVQAAIDILDEQKIPTMPYLNESLKQKQPTNRIENILVNSVGFGGNAVSVIVGTD